MSTTITLKDGKNATLRSPEEVPERRRQAVLRALSELLPHQRILGEVSTLLQGGTPTGDLAVPDGTGEAIMGALSDLIPAVILAFVREWDYGPVTEDVLLDEVPGQVYDELRDYALPQFRSIVPDFSLAGNVVGTNGDGAPIIDRAGPTPPSAG